MESVAGVPSIQPIFPPFGFLDNEQSMVDRIADWQGSLGMPIKSTDDIRTSLEWVERGDIHSLVTDLRLEEGVTGLDVIERARELNPIMPAFVVTAFEPSPQERRQAEGLGVAIYRKDDQFEDLLKVFQNRFRVIDSERVSQLEARVQILEQLTQEWTKDLVSALGKIRDPQEARIVGGVRSFTVAELIDDIKNLRPRGIEHIRLWRRLVSTLIDLK